MKQKVSNFITWLSNLPKIWGIILAVSAIVTLIATIAVNLDHRKDKVLLNEQTLIRMVVSDSVDRIETKVFQSYMMSQFDSINRKLSKVQRTQIIQGIRQEDLKNLVVDQFAKSMTPEQILNMWKQLDKKKETSIFEIPYRLPN